MPIRIGRVKAATATYREFLDGVPSMYTVDGLPAGQRASIAQFGKSWKILRIVDDIPGTWTGNYSTPQEAETALSIEVIGSAPDVIRGPQPGDGIARQNENGQWRVYHIEFDGALHMLGGPYGKQAAIEHLRTLVPVEKGDQWVIDVWGVAHTLN